MADVSHELGALRFVVDSPLSSKVAMFNKQTEQHQQNQLLNPFSGTNGRISPKPTFSKDEYGKPLAGSLTEMRGQKANMHVLREMLELCQIISSEGYTVKDEPTMRVIPFGELFNIYNYISDKVVGILLRARKHKLVEFEGEMLFQRRDDDVPIFLLRPILDIRRELEAKIEDIKRGTSPAPQATTLLLDKDAHQQKLQESSLSAPKRKSTSRSPTPSPATSKASSPAPAEPAQSIAAATEPASESRPPPVPPRSSTPSAQSNTTETATNKATAEQPQAESIKELKSASAEIRGVTEAMSGANINGTNSTELPTIVIEASAEFTSSSNAPTEAKPAQSVTGATMGAVGAASTEATL